METSDLYDFLLHAVDRDSPLLLTFDDGDKYSLGKIDFCYSIGLDGQRDDEPLRVNFEECLNDSRKRLQALRDGHLNTPGVCWTSMDPIEPVGMSYLVENVSVIWDDEKNYAVYERNSGESTPNPPDNNAVNRSGRRRGS